MANCFANEVIAGAINAINRHETVPTAPALADRAAELPSNSQTRKWLLEQRKRSSLEIPTVFQKTTQRAANPS